MRNYKIDVIKMKWCEWEICLDCFDKIQGRIFLHAGPWSWYGWNCLKCLLPPVQALYSQVDKEAGHRAVLSY